MNLFDKIKSIWQNESIGFENRLNVWLDTLNYGAEFLRLAKKEFHRWAPFRAYVSVTKTKSRVKGLFSLRFFGQEVANLTVYNKEVFLELDRHEHKNKRWFNVSLADGRYPWKGKEAKKFRADFKALAVFKKGMPEVKSIEHRVESKFIIEMCKGSGKFGIENLRIQPVMIAGKFPLQIPVPISANTGEPKAGNGYIDILARHRLRDNKTNLSVWELKKPGAYQHAVSQAYIYAVTLLQIIRCSRKGSEWFRLLGFSSQVPKSLEVEAVVAIDRNQKDSFEREKAILEKTTPFRIANDKIRLFAAYYKEESEAIILEQDPFIV
ncbi:MAG: hypothetical protein NTW46_00390 [Candidatus Nealsonbacteria bacterium]|nr:hypothetical protein [Candidatus Nealsonbacteria bacterium]